MSMKYITAAALVAITLPIYFHLSQQEHSFDPSPGINSRAERVAKLKLPIGERLKNFPGLTEYFVNKDGLYIYYRRWMPILNEDVTPPRGIVIISHGLGEHIGRYVEVAKALNKVGFIVYGLDHQGHGRSEGDRLFVKKFQDFSEDLLVLTRLAKRENPGLKTFLLSHSMGSAIAIKLLTLAQEEFTAAVISAPAVMIDPKQVSPAMLQVVRLLASSLPRLPIDKLGLAYLCKELTVVDLYKNDPLVYHGMIPARLGAEVLSFADNIKNEAPKIRIPYLLIHGTQDGLVLPAGSDQFHSLTSSTDKKYVKVEGGYHEVLNENVGVVGDVVKYLVSRL
jgi:alpha-beta hydrolase superfamily lysophospholipase